MQIYQIIDHFNSTLKEIYPKEEVTAILELILEHELSYTRLDIITNRNTRINVEAVQKIYAILDRLIQNEPIQYILGQADFYDLKFKVAPGVLIPRQETEILVDTLIKEFRGKELLKIMDLCTGSGCIAISLAQFLERSEVSALDVSDQALKIATENAIRNKVLVDFRQADLLSMNPEGSFDIIVSNPPYVRASEKKHMHKNVLDYEPDLALFVEDDDPLLFYRAIARFSKKTLNEAGFLFVEINEALGKETKCLFEDYGFSDCRLVKDLNGKDRFVRARRK